jgi:hypothetical protein
MRIAELGLRIADWLVVLTLIAWPGCDSRAPIGVPPRVLKQPRDVRGDGVVRGRIKLVGTPPVMAMIDNQICHDGAEPIKEETVVVGGDGSLKNVFVYLTSASLPAVDGSTLPPAMLDQANCRYVPHAVGVCVNQPLRVHSSDATTVHNVHYSPQHNASGNLTMTGAGQEKTIAFGTAEFINVKCDVHPWMSAYVGVFDNPFFAVTGDDGSFEIKGVPSGQYTLNVWHERYGKLERSVSVTDGSPAAMMDLVYEQPK